MFSRSHGGVTVNIKEKNKKIAIKYRKKIFFLLILLTYWFIIPSTKIIDESFVVFNYAEKEEPTRNLDLKIRINKYSKLFPVGNCRIIFEIDDRTYRYNSKDFKSRKKKLISLKTGIFNFGVLLTNSNFSEFVVIFDEKYHHYDESIELEFIVYPQRNEEESRKLLNELIEYNKYNIDNR